MTELALSLGASACAALWSARQLSLLFDHPPFRCCWLSPASVLRVGVAATLLSAAPSLLAAAATSVSVVAAMSGPSSCTCGCARDWSVRCCFVSGCRFGRWCGRFRPARGGGQVEEGILVVRRGCRRWRRTASHGGLAVLPGSSVLRRIARWKESATPFRVKASAQIFGST